MNSAVIVVGLVLAIGVHWYLRTKHVSRSQQQSARSDAQPPFVPFVVLHDSLPGLGNHRKRYHEVLRSILEQYKTEGSQALAGLSSMLDEALTTEVNLNLQSNPGLLSAKIHNRIQQTASCLEHDETVVQALLGNFEYTLALPEKARTRPNTKSNTYYTSPQTTSNNTNFRIHGSSHKPIMMNASDTHSYDSATQILAHLVRDWTSEGQAIRNELYDWCVQQMAVYGKQSPSTILVPGSGMGRLAYDLSLQGHCVEANELSPSMAAAAQAVLNAKVRGQFHPYLLDGMANEVDSKRRFASEIFPDIPIRLTNLSYTIGNFVGSEDDYYKRERGNSFDAIVTCFFIDTAANIYEYLQAIENLLKPKGVWINVGPVQWHHNALLRPSVGELKELLQACGWKLKHWSIDTRPISYRDQQPQAQQQQQEQQKSLMPPPMTSYDGYRPLRFVAIKSN